MMAWLQQKTAREQKILLSIALCVLLIFVYAFLYLPINRANSRLQTRIDHYQADLVNMQSMATQLQKLAGTQHNTTPFNKSRIMTLIEQSAQQQQLKIAQLRPLNTHHLVVILENTLFNDSLRWLDSLQTHYPITVEKFTATSHQESTHIQITLSY